MYTQHRNNVKQTSAPGHFTPILALCLELKTETERIFAIQEINQECSENLNFFRPGRLLNLQHLGLGFNLTNSLIPFFLPLDMFFL